MFKSIANIFLEQTSFIKLFLCFFLYSFLISWEYLFLPEIAINLNQITSLIFSLNEHLAYALLCSVLLIFLRKLFVPPFVLTVIAAALLSILLFNRIFYQIFYQHFSWSAIESGMKFNQLWGSFYAELVLLDLINGLILLLLLFPIYQALSQKEQTLINQSNRWNNIYTKLLLIFIISTLYSYYLAIGNLHQNPLLRTIYSIAKSSSDTPVTRQLTKISLADIYQPISVSKKTYPSVNRPLITPKNTSGETSTKKNIVLIVLESVGSLQLFPDGKISKEVTPFLDSIREHSTLFNSIYTYYPATTRSHVPLQTGGVSFTYATTKDLAYPFKGQTLTSALKQSGYRTALFSAQQLNFGNLDKFYEQMNFDHYSEPDKEGLKFSEVNKVHSWGVFETAVLPKAFDWIDQKASLINTESKQTTDNKPFFLQFFTASSHHPYGYPGSSKERKKLPRLERYKKSLRYTDDVLKQVWQQLKQRNLLDNTLIYITGDHGQAFGVRHKKNFTHRNYIYDENVLTFLLSLNVSQQDEVVSNRPGSIGDVMPTLVNDSKVNESNSSALSKVVATSAGQDLYSENYQPRMQFFHKHQMPAQWGARDGEWKFISEQKGIKNAELYHLINDPGEKKNLAASYPEIVKQYQQRISHWSYTMQDLFSQQLKTENLLSLSPEELSTPGAKKMRLGFKAAGSSFKVIKAFHPDEDIVAQVYQIPDGKKHQYEFSWIDPSGSVTKNKKVTFKETSERLYNDLDLSKSMREGDWKLIVKSDEGRTFEQKFQVSKNAPLYDPRHRALGPKEIEFFYQDEFGKQHQQKVFHPQEQIIIKGHGHAYSKDKVLQLQLTSPTSKIYIQSISLLKNQKSFQLELDNFLSMEAGTWLVKILDKKRIKVTAKIDIDPKEILHQQKQLDIKQRQRNIKSENYIKKKKRQSKAISQLVIIDDNINKAHMQIYGYLRQNMSNLSSLLEKQQNTEQANLKALDVMKSDLKPTGKLIRFKSVYYDKNKSDSVRLPLLLSSVNTSDNKFNSNNTPSLIDLYKAVDIPTTWIGVDTEYDKAQYKQISDIKLDLPIFKHPKGKKLNQYKLLQQINSILNKQKESGGLIIVHIPRLYDESNICLNISPYNQLLKEAELGRNSNNKRLTKAVNCHDNHVVIMDQLLIQLTQLENKPSMFWYGSNFTPHIFEKMGHLGENFSNSVRDIPLLAWFSDEFSQEFSDEFLELNTDKISILKKNRNKNYSINSLYNSLLALSPIEATLYNPKHDLSSRLFKASPLIDLKNKQTSSHSNDKDETTVKHRQQQNIREIHSEQLGLRLLPHRVNTLGKLKQAQYDGFKAYELDVMFKSITADIGYFIVGHDKKALSGLSLESFLKRVPKSTRKIWFDIKNISEENIDAVLSRLNFLNNKFHIKEKVIIESDLRKDVYAKIADAGYYTSYYLPTKKLLKLIKTDQQDELKDFAELVYLQAAKQKLKALSFDSKLYSYVKNIIEPGLEKPLEYHTWDMSVPLIDSEFWAKITQKYYYWDDNVKTVLLAYYSEFTL